MTGFGKFVFGTMLMTLGATATGCGDDTSSGAGGGGGGGAGSTTSADSSSAAEGPGAGPGTTSSGAVGSSGANSSGNGGGSSSSGGGDCGVGTGTPEELRAAYEIYCEVATPLAQDACASEATVQDCIDLGDLVVQGAAGCEAEAVAVFDCGNAILEDIDSAECTCPGNQLDCGIDANACAAEKAAQQACDACNG